MRCLQINILSRGFTHLLIAITCGCTRTLLDNLAETEDSWGCFTRRQQERPHQIVCRNAYYSFSATEKETYSSFNPFGRKAAWAGNGAQTSYRSAHTVKFGHMGIDHNLAA